MQEFSGRDALSSGGLHQTGKDAVGSESAIRSGSKADLAEDHQMPQGLFGKIIRRWHAGMPEEPEEKLLLGSCEISSKGLGGFETNRRFADVVEFGEGLSFDFGRLAPGKNTGVELVCSVAESGAQVDEAVAEAVGSRVLLGLRQERMFSADFLRVGDEMGEADLPVRTDPVIGGIPVTHQRSVEVLPEDAFRHIGRAMPIDLIEGEMFIACEPYKMPHAVIAPRNFIAVHHLRGPDLLAQILVERLALRCRFAVELEGGGRGQGRCPVGSVVFGASHFLPVGAETLLGG